MKFYILSLTRMKGDTLTWWGPNNSGYTPVLDNAGKYDGEDIFKRPEYYDNKKETAAIPCEWVDEFAIKVVSSDNMTKFLKYIGIAEEVGVR